MPFPRSVHLKPTPTLTLPLHNLVNQAATPLSIRWNKQLHLTHTLETAAKILCALKMTLYFISLRTPISF